MELSPAARAITIHTIIRSSYASMGSEQIDRNEAESALDYLIADLLDTEITFAETPSITPHVVDNVKGAQAMEVSLIVTLQIDEESGRTFTSADATQSAHNVICEALRVAIDRKLVYGAALKRVTTASVQIERAI
jgi:hypothetical protein